MLVPKFAWGAVAGGAALALTTDLLSILLHRWIPKSLPIDEYFRTPASAYMLAAFGILVAPAVEELFFRGFLYPALARPIGVFPPPIITPPRSPLIHSTPLPHPSTPLLL